jgi:hypothetical protein
VVRSRDGALCRNVAQKSSRVRAGTEPPTPGYFCQPLASLALRERGWGTGAETTDQLQPCLALDKGPA